MQLISLNIWGGHIKGPLLEFFNENQHVDIFCLQEVYNNAKAKNSTDDRQVYLNIYSEIQEVLSDHLGYFCSVVDDNYGICCFIKKSVNIINMGEVCIHENLNYSGMGPDHSRKLQWFECIRNHEKFYVLNVHGLWNGEGKLDSESRIEQSYNIKNFMNSLDAPAILCGDFNLRPDTQSLKIIGEGLTNLITNYNIIDTRTSFYKKSERFADYVFTTNNIKVNSFQVFNDEISDHASLQLDFSVKLNSFNRADQISEQAL